jgi:hypothetical protein
MNNHLCREKTVDNSLDSPNTWLKSLKNRKKKKKKKSKLPIFRSSIERQKNRHTTLPTKYQGFSSNIEAISCAGKAFLILLP